MSYKALNVLRAAAAFACFAAAARYLKVYWGTDASPGPFVILLVLGFGQLIMLDLAVWGKDKCKRKR